jgi:hypothetical protein
MQAAYAKMQIPQGYLIYAAEDSLRVLNLRSRIDRPLYKLSNSLINHLSKANENKIVFHVSSYHEFIYELNLKTMRLTSLVEGYGPTFILAHNGYYYFPMQGCCYLFFKKSDHNGYVKIGKALGAIDGDHIVPIDDDRMVYIPPNYESKGLLRLYNLKTRSSKTLHITGCDDVYIWRSATKQLLCCDNKDKYFLTDLDGSNRQYINPRGDPVLYLPKSDDLIINDLESWHFLTEVYDIAIYNFKKDKAKVLLKERGLGLNDAVYFEHLPKKLEEKLFGKKKN